jgi:hypothetical protein
VQREALLSPLPVTRPRMTQRILPYAIAQDFAQDFVIGIGGVLQLELATAGSTRPIDRHASEDRHDDYDLRVPDFRPVDRYNESAGTNY